MSTGATPTAPGVSVAPTRERIVWFASVAFCGVLPALVLMLVFASAVSDGSFAIDFRPFHRAAEAILAGESPYPSTSALLTASGGPYVYPPLPALLTVPLTVLSPDVAGVLVMATLVVVTLAIPWVLGVSDWRCYGILLLWPPVLSAIQTGNVTLLLVLAAALAWRFRDNVAVGAASAGATLAVKFLLWPLLVWLVATRRAASAVVAAAVGVGLLLASWAVIGFDGMRGYADLLRRLEGVVGDDAYTLFNLVDDLGAPELVARAAWLGLGVGLVAGCVRLARRGDERSAFILALAAALALTPLVWLHYFALLAVPVALARTRLGIVWLVPLALVFADGQGDPTPVVTAATLGTVALTLLLSLRESRQPVVTA